MLILLKFLFHKSSIKIISPSILQKNTNLKNNNNNQDDIKVWELTNGCICCSTNLDFTHSILTIANTINPEFLIIEPSGVAKIKNIIEKIIVMKELNWDYQY